MAATFVSPPKEELRAVLLDLNKPIAQRMRSIFYLRTLGGEDSVEVLCQALRNKEGTTLFRHEIAYVLGQMQAKSAVPTLTDVLVDTTDDPIVRHEAGEALGAIADPSSLDVLDKFRSDERSEVAETCQIAYDRLKWAMEHKDDGEAETSAHENPYESVDPAPAKPKPSKKEDFVVLSAQLIDTSLPLFERYKIMFTLRNNGSKGAVKALCAGLNDPSPLFRHEIAYVLGQMANEHSKDALMECVVNPDEHEMVRHEAAEALGAIGTPECVEFLQKYADDGTVMLRESCQVALDVVDYWSTNAEGLEAGQNNSSKSTIPATTE